MFSRKEDGPALEPIRIGEREYPVRLKRRRVKNAYARVSEGAVVITLPRWTGFLDTDKIIGLLYKKMERFLERHPSESTGLNLIQLRDQTVLRVLDEDYNIIVKEGGRAGFRRMGHEIIVRRPEGMPEATLLEGFRRAVVREFMPRVEMRVSELNQSNFGSKINGVRLRDNIYRWGSCSPDNTIILNMRLLFAPREMLDYVIVHELAHTKYRNHSKRFWETVRSVIPDYRARKRWIRENGAKLPTTKSG